MRSHRAAQTGGVRGAKEIGMDELFDGDSRKWKKPNEEGVLRMLPVDRWRKDWIEERGSTRRNAWPSVFEGQGRAVNQGSCHKRNTRQLSSAPCLIVLKESDPVIAGTEIFLVRPGRCFLLRGEGSPKAEPVSLRDEEHIGKFPVSGRSWRTLRRTSRAGHQFVSFLWTGACGAGKSFPISFSRLICPAGDGRQKGGSAKSSEASAKDRRLGPCGAAEPPRLGQMRRGRDQTECG